MRGGWKGLIGKYLSAAYYLPQIPHQIGRRITVTYVKHTIHALTFTMQIPQRGPGLRCAGGVWRGKRVLYACVMGYGGRLSIRILAREVQLRGLGQRPFDPLHKKKKNHTGLLVLVAKQLSWLIGSWRGVLGMGRTS